jgi:GGDEF domain-containing protein
MNVYAKDVLGREYEDVRDVFEGKKIKLPKEVIDGENKLLEGIKMNTANDGNIEVDMDVNVIMVDNVHLVLVLFEESYKKIFSSMMNVHAMRVAWKYVNARKIYMNKVLREDINGSVIEAYYNEPMIDKFREIEKRVIEEGLCHYNSIQMITLRDKSSHFIKANIMPIINGNDEYIGVVSVHNKILDKDSSRKVYDNVLQKMNKDAVDIDSADVNNEQVDIKDNVESINESSIDTLSNKGEDTNRIFVKKGIPDRIKFEEDVKDYIIKSIGTGNGGTLLMFRIENFEYIKYNVGALYIEELVKQFEHSIKEEPLLTKRCYKSRNTEYLVLLDNKDEKEIYKIIHVINKLFNGTRTVRDKEIDCEINIGVTYFPEDGIKSTALLKNLDFAIYEAKACEGVNYKFYDMEKRI